MTTTMPQLRVRTEYSFRDVFGPVPRVAARLKALGVPAAGCVDVGGTWGHVKWERELTAGGIQPLFGVEAGLAAPGGAPGGGAETPRRPTRTAVDGPAGAPAAPRPTPGGRVWALAQETPALYRLSTAAAGAGGALAAEAFLGAAGVVRFAGTGWVLNGRLAEALRAGVWLDLNPGAGLLNRRAVATARAAGLMDRCVITSDNAFPAPTDRALHEMMGRGQKPTPQHIMTESELRAHFAPLLSAAELDRAVRNAYDIAAQLQGVKLARAPLIKLQGDVEALCRAGIAERLAAGQLAAWTDEYEQRLQRELALVREKEFDSYFLMVADMVRWAKQRMLVGPARGSAAGSLMCWLMAITEIDPLPYGLLFERFVDITRKDLPDIDIDFPDTTRDMVYDYLRQQYTPECVARIGTISEFKPKSALAEVAKRLQVPVWETQGVRDAMFVRSSGDSRANNCLIDTLNETAPGRGLLERYPAIALAGEIEGHASHSGQHAAGVIVCNEPISNFCTVEGGIAQLDKIDAEALGLLKIDVLGLRTLSIIEDAGVLTRDEVYRLRFDDPAVFALLNSGRFTGIFQWEGKALQSLTRQVDMQTFEDMVHITALARPGPLGGGAANRFIARRSRGEPVDVAHPGMLEYLGETFGLVLYQEQVMRIVREIGRLTWDDTSTLRKAMSKSYGKEYFDRFRDRFALGAQAQGFKLKEAHNIWDQVNSMGAWAFNKSHSVSYAIVSYWTAWLKAHYPLQYAAAALRNAKDHDTAVSLLRELHNEGTPYVPFDPQRSGANWSVQDGQLIGGFLQLKGIGPATAATMLKQREKDGRLTDKQLEKLARAEPLFGDLFPAHSRWRDYYERPEACGLRHGTRVLNIADFEGKGGEVVFIGVLAGKDARDHNETVRVARRNGKRWAAPTLFLDMRLSDDTTLTPLLCRVDRFEYEPTGRMVLERGREGHHWFLVRGEKLANFPMVQVHKLKCLNEPDFFKE